MATNTRTAKTQSTEPRSYTVGEDFAFYDRLPQRVRFALQEATVKLSARDMLKMYMRCRYGDEYAMLSVIEKGEQREIERFAIEYFMQVRSQYPFSLAQSGIVRYYSAVKQRRPRRQPWYDPDDMRVPHGWGRKK